MIRNSKSAWSCLKIAIVLALAIIVISSIVYFHNHYISKDISYWSNFGIFYWGILSLIVSVVNLYFFISISNNVSKIQEERNNKNYTGEQKRFLTEYRHKAINSLTNTLSNFHTNLFIHTQSNQNKIDFNFIHFEIIKFEEELRSLTVLNAYFFEDYPLNFDKIFLITAKIKNNKDDKANLNTDLNDLRRQFYLILSSLQKFNVDKFAEHS